MRYATIVFCLLLIGISKTTSSQVKEKHTFIIEWTMNIAPHVKKASIFIERKKSTEYFGEHTNNGRFTYHTFLQPGDTVSFYLSLGDSLSGYYIFNGEIREKTILIPIALKRNTSFLEEIIIAPPAIYRKGNTSVFRADAFLHKQDQTLGDLLKRLPYFRLEEDGRLTFKGKTIPSIRIQGEDIFASQTQLLSQHIPAKVIQSLEVLEHGLNDTSSLGNEKAGELTLNLIIKKEYLQRPWGNAQTGAGIGKRPFHTGEVALFALWSKWKGGWVGNLRSDGQTANQTDLLQLKSPNLLLFSSMGDPPFTLLKPAQLDNRHFIRNELFHQRIQLNRQLKNHNHLSWETHYLKDQGKQIRELNTKRISENGLHVQKWNSMQTWKPNFIFSTFKFKHQFNSKESIQFMVRWIHESDLRTGSNEVKEEETKAKHVHQNKHTIGTLQLQTECIFQPQPHKTTRIQSDVELSQFVRDDWGTIGKGNFFMNASDTLPAHYLQLLRHQLFRSRIRLERSNKKRKYRSPLQWELEWMALRLRSPMYLHASINPDNKIFLNHLSGEGSYRTAQLVVSEGIEKRSKHNTYKLSGQIGIAGLMNEERISPNQSRKLIPLLRIMGEWESHSREAGIWRSGVFYFKGRRDLTQITRIPLPRQPLQFLQYVAPSAEEHFFYGNTSYWGSIANGIKGEIDARAEYRFISQLSNTEIAGPFTHIRIRHIHQPSENAHLGFKLYWLKNPNVLTMRLGTQLDYRREYFLLPAQTEKATIFSHTSEWYLEWYPFSNMSIKNNIRLQQSFAIDLLRSSRKDLITNRQFFHELYFQYKLSRKYQFESTLLQLGNLQKCKLINATRLVSAKLDCLLFRNCRFVIAVDNLLNSRIVLLQHENLGYTQSSLSVPINERSISASLKWQF